MSAIDPKLLTLLTESELIEFLKLYQQPYEPINTNYVKNLENSANLLQIVLQSNQQITPTLLNLWLSTKLNFEGSQTYTSEQILKLPKDQLLMFMKVFNDGLVLSGLPENFIVDDENLSNNILQILRFKGMSPKPVSQQISQPIIKDTPSKLLPIQIAHFQRVNNIINTRWYAYQDTTPMGGGKTYIISELARSMQQQNPNVSLLVVAPKSVHTKWRKVPKSFGIPVLDAINYETLAGKVGYDLKNPYLTRMTTGKTSNYSITPYYDEIVKRGILLTFDENQLIKNKTALRSLASLALIRHIILLNQRGQSNSRIALLSASPGNNTDHTFSILKMLGVTTNIDVVVDGDPVGLRDVYNFARNIDAGKADGIINGTMPTDRTEALQLAHELYRDIIKQYISSAAPMPEIAAGRDYKNGYYRITSDIDIQYVQTGLDILNDLRKRREHKRRSKDKDDAQKDETVIGLMTTAMLNIEAGKINDLARVANQTLISNPMAKVIIGVNYKNSVNRLVGLLSAYSPLILTGDVHGQNKRDAIIDRFQEPNTSSRLLIMITTVGSVGLDLDDKYGQFPRYMYIVPDFHFLTKYQATGRIARADTKSMPTLRFFYGRGVFVEENKLLDSMVKKSGIAKDLLATGNPTPFPGDFDPYVETI